MKLIYVASPYAGDVKKNTEFAKEACRHAMSEGHAFFAPHLLYPAILDDSQPQERQLGIDMGLAMLKHCDELWCYGARISYGMHLEIEEAEKLGVPTRRVLEQGNCFVLGNVKNKQPLTHDPKQLPAFDSNNFEIKSREYGNTGGGCMVGTVQFYLPELERSLWVNCNEESASIATADYMWNSDGSECWECYEDVLVAAFYFTESPEEWSQWAPMVRETLAYTIEQETSCGKSFSLPVAWLPDSIRETVAPEYLDWLQAEGKELEVANECRAVIDEAFHTSGHATPGIEPMGMQ